MIVALALLISAPADPVVGTWEGTSLCQVKPSPCHDEHAIYRVTASGQGGYRFQMYKVVAGEEQLMGPLDVKPDRSGTLVGSTLDRAGVAHQWLFSVRAKHMSGRLMTSANGQVYRLIELDKR